MNLQSYPVKITDDSSLPEGRQSFPFIFNSGDAGWTVGTPPSVPPLNIGVTSATQWIKLQFASQSSAQLTQIRCVDVSLQLSDGEEIDVYLWIPSINRLVTLTQHNGVTASTAPRCINACVEINAPGTNTEIYVIVNPSAGSPSAQGQLIFNNYKKDQFFDSGIIVS